MSEEDKNLAIELLEMADEYDSGHCESWPTIDILKKASNRIYKLNGKVDSLREKLAAAYIKLSGRTEHASDCATSNAPAKDPAPCDCGPPDDLRRAIVVELTMTALANEDASSEWIEGFQHACKRVGAVLGDTK